MNKNIILNSDSYKAGHYRQYPPGTEYVYSYIEARSGIHPSVVAFGLQAFLKEYLTNPFTMDDIDEAEAIFSAHGVPFNRAGWEYILTEHKGFLPLEIKMVPEGTKVGIRNVMATMVNTDSNVPWLTNYMETAVLRAIWYPTTVATNSYYVKQSLIDFWKKSSMSPIESLDFKLHDFGARGVSSNESAGIGGMAHLINFMGTDTIEALRYASEYYGADMAGFSIPAAEHSTITSWGEDRETDAYRNMINSFDSPIVAIVSDSYDLMNAVSNIYGGTLKMEIMNSGKTIVVRPDSGNPAEIVVETINGLIQKFGYTRNAKGYKVLPDCIRVIQGDGITPESLKLIITAMDNAALSIDNIAFGMGGGLLQMCNRDTYGFAQKASAIQIDGVWNDVYKNPKTDPAKASKRGRFLDESYGLQTVFIDGALKNEITFDEVRANSRK